MYYIAPERDRSDRYAAGYDGNRFESQEEAIEAIESLRAMGGEWDIEWVIVEMRDADDAAACAADHRYDEQRDWDTVHARGEDD